MAMGLMPILRPRKSIALDSGKVHARTAGDQSDTAEKRMATKTGVYI